MKRKTIPMSLIICGYISLAPSDIMAQDPSYPFPPYPIITQSYLNRSTPLLFAYVDNSATMNSAIRIRNANNQLIHTKDPYKNYAPNRLDLVKNSLYRLADDYYYDFRWVLYSIKDNSYNSGWEPFTSEDLGFVAGKKPIWEYDSRYAFLKDLPLKTQKAMVKSKGTSNTGSRPLGPNGSYLPHVKYQERNKSSGWMRSLDFNNRQYTSWPKVDEYYNNLSSQYTAGHPMRYAPVKMPLELEKGVTNVKDSHFLKMIEKSKVEKNKFMQAIKSISIVSGTAFMEDSFPQMLNANRNGYNNNGDQKAYVTFNNSARDMLSVADFVEYRCQDIFALVFADGNRVGIAKNYLAAKEGAQYHPMANYHIDKEGKFYNGTDFPNQYIYTGGIGLDNITNKAAYELFAQNGAISGKKPLYLVSEDSDEVADFIDDFVENNRPRSFFSAAAPASVDPDAKTRLIISLHTEANRWASYLKINAVGTSSQNIKALYSPTAHTIIGQSPKQKGWLNISKSSNATLQTHFDNRSLGIVGGTNQYQLYLPWLITSTYSDKDTGYRSRSLVEPSIMGAQTKDGSNEFRYTGGGLNTNLLQAGDRNNNLGILQHLIFGSNDGMLKVYTATNEAATPYRYTLGILPGNMKQTKNFTLYQSIFNRAEPDFGKSDQNPHVYGINGGISTRLTNNGQLIGVSALGQGGQGIFTFNLSGIDEITQQAVGMSAKQTEWEKTVPLWTSDDNATMQKDMGYVTGAPIISLINLYRDKDNIPTYSNIFLSVISSNGIQNTAKDNRLSIINALGKNFGEKQSSNYEAGQLIKQIMISPTITQNPTNESKVYSGFTSPMPVDLDLDGIADVAYMGTREGDVYRLDMRYASPDDWTLLKVFSGTPDLPISHTPTIGRVQNNPQNPSARMVAFSTGSTLFGQDIFNDTPQKIVSFQDDMSQDPTPVTYQDLRQNTTQESEYGSIAGVSSNVLIRNIIVDESKKMSAYKGWSLTLPTQLVNNTFKGKEQGNMGMSIEGQSLILTTNSLKIDSFAAPTNDQDQEKPKPVVCFRDLTAKGGSFMVLNMRNGGLPTTRDIHLTTNTSPKKMVAGFVTNDITSPALAISNKKRYATNDDGAYNLYNELADAKNPKVLPHFRRGNSMFTKLKAGEPPRTLVSQEVACQDQNHGAALSVGNTNITVKLEQDCSLQKKLARLSWHEI